jgi:molybdopterin biosynthesis enzyme
VINEMGRRFTYLTPQEAIDAITKAMPFRQLGSERILVSNAYGRIVAEDIVAQVNLPPHDMSHFDGYAIRAEDTKEASVQNPLHLTVIGKLYPGQTPEYEVRKGEAVYVTTGSFLPKGANTIVAVEATKRIQRTQIEVRSPVSPHEHVIRCGSDIKQGVTLFQERHTLRA